MKIKNINVIGSGISGASISKMLSKTYEVQLLEKTDTPGGLIKCKRVNDVLFHKVGGHVFNSKNSLVVDWFWQYFNKNSEFINAKRNAKVLLNGALCGYPIENYLYQIPRSDSVKILNNLLKLVELKSFKKQGVANFQDHLLNSFGSELYALYFKPYNEKIWNMDLSKIPLDWLEGKLPLPNLEEIISSNIFREEESNMVHSSFYYPKINGSQFIIDRLLLGLNIKLGYEVTSISFLEPAGKLSINEDLISDAIVYTGDVRHLSNLIKINDTPLRKNFEELRKLKSNGTTNILCHTDKTELSWLYLPDASIKAHRIIYTGNFSDTNNDDSGRSSCVVEFSGKHEPAELYEELKKLPGNLSPIASNYEPNSYIIQDFNTRSLISDSKSLLKKYNIYLLGRFAEWEYFNMDKCIESAFNIESEINLFNTN